MNLSKLFSLLGFMVSFFFYYVSFRLLLSDIAASELYFLIQAKIYNELAIKHSCLVVESKYSLHSEIWIEFVLPSIHPCHVSTGDKPIIYHMPLVIYIYKACFPYQYIFENSKGLFITARIIQVIRSLLFTEIT
ncbi:hypothetical protein ACJX0J_038065 [Zea mays]